MLIFIFVFVYYYYKNIFGDDYLIVLIAGSFAGVLVVFHHPYKFISLQKRFWEQDWKSGPVKSSINDRN
ncbi:hypothetical protein KAJ27_02565 [bacterium]|nr:hypothetical protein [bacterium]